MSEGFLSRTGNAYGEMLNKGIAPRRVPGLVSRRVFGASPEAMPRDADPRMTMDAAFMGVAIDLTREDINGLAHPMLGGCSSVGANCRFCGRGCSRRSFVAPLANPASRSRSADEGLAALAAHGSAFACRPWGGPIDPPADQPSLVMRRVTSIQ